MTHIKTTMKRNTKLTLGLVAVAVLMTGSPLLACQRCDTTVKRVKHQHDYRIDQLKSAVDAERDAIRCAKRDGLKRIAYDLKAARKLCEPARSCALRDIKSARKALLSEYRYDMAALRKWYAGSLADLRRSYTVAVRQAKSYCVTVKPVVVETVTTCDTCVQPELVFEEDIDVIEPGYGMEYESIPDNGGYESDWEVIEGPVFPEPAPANPVPMQPIPVEPEFVIPDYGYNPHQSIPRPLPPVTRPVRPTCTTVVVKSQPTRTVVVKPVVHTVKVTTVKTVPVVSTVKVTEVEEHDHSHSRRRPLISKLARLLGH